jgi:glycogen synthase
VHVLVTADSIGGVWTYTRELVCGLLNRGHQVTLVSFGKMPTSGQAFWVNQKKLVYYPTKYPLEWMHDSKAGIEESEKYLQRIIADTRPDVLHSSQYCYGALECGIPKIVVAHSDVVSWWKSVHGNEPPDSAWMRWYRSIVSAGLAHADMVVSPSAWMLEALRESYEGPNRARVIYNGRTEKLFHPSKRKSVNVLSVGRVWDEAKQIRLLLERKHRVPIRIAGPAEHPDKAISSADLNFGNNFQFCGEQDEKQLSALYSEAAAYAATSRYEPFGLAPVEAALSRCALIANDIPVFRELWGDSAFYFKRNDPDDLARAISILAEDTSRRRAYAEQAYDCARTRFSSERMVADYEELYQSLAGKGANA